MRPRELRRHGLQTLLVLAAVLACDRGEPAPTPRKVDRRVDTQRIPVPNHGPEVMAGTHEVRRTKSAEGIIEAMLDGDHVEHTFLPYGMNSAISSEKTGVSRLSLVGSPTDAGYPALHLVFEGLKLDEVELPKTFTNREDETTERKPKPKPKPKPAFPKILYYEAEQVVFEANPDREESFEVTIEAFEGNTVRGTFEATVVPRAKHFGEPKRLESGRFEVTLRLSGIEPGASDSNSDDAP
jgi:hypothetical protein